MPYIAAIDLGSGFTKAVVLATDGPSARVIGRGRVKSGVDFEKNGHDALDAAIRDACLDSRDIAYIATTGFGRYGVSDRDVQITEITTAARGAHFLSPRGSFVLDVGSQCTRAISLTPEGRVKAFKTNDKCAAGSGSFIVRAAKYLEVALDDIGEMGIRSTNAHSISSVCAVLAESEIINLVSMGVSVEDILRGIHDSLAERAATLLRRVGFSGELTFIGGVAKQRGMKQALETRLKVPVYVPEDCDYVCAIGAALLGRQRYDSNRPTLRGVELAGVV